MNRDEREYWRGTIAGNTGVTEKQTLKSIFRCVLRLKSLKYPQKRPKVLIFFNFFWHFSRQLRKRRNNQLFLLESCCMAHYTETQFSEGCCSGHPPLTTPLLQCAIDKMMENLYVDCSQNIVILVFGSLQHKINLTAYAFTKLTLVLGDSPFYAQLAFIQFLGGQHITLNLRV